MVRFAVQVLVLLQKSRVPHFKLQARARSGDSRPAGSRPADGATTGSGAGSFGQDRSAGPGRCWESLGGRKTFQWAHARRRWRSWSGRDPYRTSGEVLTGTLLAPVYITVSNTSTEAEVRYDWMPRDQVTWTFKGFNGVVSSGRNQPGDPEQIRCWSSSRSRPMRGLFCFTFSEWS